MENNFGLSVKFCTLNKTGQTIIEENGVEKREFLLVELTEGIS